MKSLPDGSRQGLGSTLLLLVALAPQIAFSMLDCSQVKAGDHTWDLRALKGPHSVSTSEKDGKNPRWKNTTYTLDLCANLRRKDGVPKDEECELGTRVCAISHDITKKPNGELHDVIERVIPISYAPVGTPLDYELQRLSTSDSLHDSKLEGLRVTLKGGMYNRVTQRAVIELRCDQSMEGTEGEWTTEDEYIPGDEPAFKAYLAGQKPGSDSGVNPSDNDEDGFPERQLLKPGAALIWEKYQEIPDRNEKILYLTWYTKHACEKRSEGDGDENPERKRWGLFTWFFVLAFLAIAAYLIFGSWLNYNRYGARGWDLLPHADAIRDFPDLLKDWIRRVLNTVQGSGSRGGYSAV